MKNRFFNLKVSAFTNKNNGQITLTLPKKKMKRFLKDKKVFPKEVKISLWKEV